MDNLNTRTWTTYIKAAKDNLYKITWQSTQDIYIFEIFISA